MNMNEKKLDKIISRYKKTLDEHYEGERYKWQAVKQFQDVWNSQIDKFSKKFKDSTDVTLLGDSAYWQPRYMIGLFCDACGEKCVEEQFNKLYDESKNLKQRVTDFIDFFADKEIIGKVNQKTGKTLKNTNQDARAVSVYLTLKYPDKYYFYKSDLYDKAKSLFDFNQPKGFSPVDKMLQYFKFCDEICAYIKKDSELIKMLQSKLTDKEYNDKSLHVLVQDILFFSQDFYIFPANSDEYDHQKAFEENGYIDWQQPRKCNVGDIVFIYFSKPYSKIRYKTVILEKNLETDSTKEYWINPENGNDNGQQKYCRIKLIEKVDTDDLNWSHLKEKGLGTVQGSQNITSKTELVNYINAVFDEKNIDRTEETEEIKNDNKYGKDDFLKEVYISKSEDDAKREYDKLFSLLEHKKNIILQGAPGVGKTYAAKRLAYSIIGKKDDDRVQCVQFHQSYSYEDFIEGFRPSENVNFELCDGVFKKFCEKASHDKENKYFFIIDEINRGNISKIFGELLMLIESDKRGEQYKINLVYSKQSFYVPENLYIIGMMNTADRSLAVIDYALRRRFAFYSMKPAFDSYGFKEYAENVKCELFNEAVKAVKELNKVIAEDKSLGKGFEIGHSYFCTDKPEDITDETVKNIIEFEIIPTIEEYWFDNETKLNEQRSKLEEIVR